MPRYTRQNQACNSSNESLLSFELLHAWPGLRPGSAPPMRYSRMYFVCIYRIKRYMPLRTTSAASVFTYIIPFRSYCLILYSGRSCLSAGSSSLSFDTPKQKNMHDQKYSLFAEFSPPDARLFLKHIPFITSYHKAIKTFIKPNGRNRPACIS